MQSKEQRDSTEPDDTPRDAPGKLPLRHVLTSVLAAAFGVQSKKNQQKDFSHKQAIYIYIAAGIAFTALFVLAVAFVVSTVLSNAG
ncbi:MAG: DUF2970 domain-containing protein [Pseudomonadales bacterium]|nr:DUF2970 domain-containing protein [Pseudomonadales bacterium]